MIHVEKNRVVSLHRGDSLRLPLFINAGRKIRWKRYLLRRDDTLYLAITEPNQPFEKAILKKVYTKEDVNNNKDVVVKLGEKDTEFLMPGKYFLEIKLQLWSGAITTVFPRTQFWILD